MVMGWAYGLLMLGVIACVLGCSLNDFSLSRRVRILSASCLLLSGFLLIVSINRAQGRALDVSRLTLYDPTQQTTYYVVSVGNTLDGKRVALLQPGWIGNSEEALYYDLTDVPNLPILLAKDHIFPDNVPVERAVQLVRGEDGKLRLVHPCNFGDACMWNK